MSVSLPKRNLLLIFLAIFAVVSILISARSFYAEALVHRWKIQLQNDTHLAENFNGSAKLERQLNTASNIESQNADYWSFQGAYYWYQSRQSDQNENIEKARSSYQRAIELEPYSGRHWLGLAFTHIEEEKLFCEYYKKAYQLGKADFYLLDHLVKAGFAFWDKLNLCSRIVLKDALRSIYSLNPGLGIELLKDSPHAKMGCLWLMDFEQSRLCKKELKD